MNRYVIKSLARAAGGGCGAQVGDVVYQGEDRYGVAEDDTRSRGEEYISVSVYPNGEPFFTIPRADVMLESAYEDRAAINMVELEKRMNALAVNAVVLIDAFQEMQKDAFLHPLTAFAESCAKHAPKIERRSMLTLLMVWRSICDTNQPQSRIVGADGAPAGRSESLGQYATNMMFDRFMRGE